MEKGRANLLRRITFFVFLLMLASIVAACGGGGSEADPTTAATEATTATATSAATPTDSPAEVTPTAEDETEAETEDVATPATPFAYGFNVFARGDEDGAEFNEQTIKMVKGAGFDWVRIQIAWDQVERAKDQWDPLPLDRIIEQFAASDVKILASVAKAPEWALDPTGEQFLRDFNDFAGFMHFLVERYGDKVAAWEIWNEQNLASEVGGVVRVSDYGKLLQAGYQGAKQADRTAVIVFGGLTPTGVNDPTIAIDDVKFLEEFYTIEGGRYATYFDVLGVHVNATHNAPELLYPDNPGTGDQWTDDPSFYFRRAEQLHAIMEQRNDQRPVWITEFGWTTENQAEGYEYGANVTEEDQAEYLVGAFAWAREHWPWTTGMFVWNLNFAVIAPPEDEKSPWGVVNPDWTPRPAYEALRDMPKS